MVASTEVSPTVAASASGSRSLKDLWALSRVVAQEPVDLFYFPAVYSYFPILNRCKVIVTIHDMIADHHPERVFPLIGNRACSGSSSNRLHSGNRT